MVKYILNNKLLFIGIHILLGYVTTLLKSSNILKLFWILIIGMFVLNIFTKKNKNEEALIFSAYLVAVEVFLRMTRGYYLYETGKYGVILFLILGVFVGKFKQKFSISLIFYFMSN